jgi:lipopolysaccharide biosynthesis glycosyltransferase
MSHLINKNSPNYLHIALGFDENYIVPIYALFTSIFINNRTNAIIFHVIVTGISQLEKDKLIDYVKQNKADILFYEINEDEVKKVVYIPDGTHFTIATYYRLFLPALLPPEITKLLYIDADTVVIGNLQPLYDVDLGGVPLAAAVDTFPSLVREDLGINEENSIFNAGVLLIDTKNWLNQKVTENAIDFILKFPEKIKYVDQDALNATLINKWYKLDSKYNFLSFEVILQKPSKHLVRDKVIIHYNTPQKPWHCLAPNKLRYLYHFYLRKSPKSQEKKYTDFKWTIKNVWIFMRMRIKEYYFDHEIDKIFPIKSWRDAKQYY